ncbi:uncharacterized protein N7477_006888 [Penicillium maclennaniae]|uniref:uncharacterized protein n=1 Tax=Penicillium maclennaniae TaxID=1343394 RepID=UPI0025415F40|nr:uncharacterized protein N7477_006888 [Penicillium maclennaniae]KAJ5668318.1 hypothetical protein N7477_006888 [Penicillium maclennaniae]
MLVHGNGTITNATLISGGSSYSLNYTLPVQQWTDVNLVANGNKSLLTVGNGKKTMIMKFLAKIGVNGEYHVWAPIGVEAPLARIGEGYLRSMQNIVLKGTAFK